jgi:hypothetical protein
MKKPLQGFLLIALFGLPMSAAMADIGVGVRASTLGIGVDGSFALTDYLVLRVGLNSYEADYDTTEDNIRYDFNADLDSRHLLLDVHPFGGVFRITGGLLDNNSEFRGTGSTVGDYDINGVTYTQQEIGTLRAGFELDDRGTYLGFGWAKSPRGTGFGFSFDVGMIKQDAPHAVLQTESGTLTGNPALQADLDAEVEQLNRDLEDFDTYPVVSAGISYHF